MRVGLAQYLGDGHIRGDGDGIADDPALVLLDRQHLAGLTLQTHVLVDDADAALEGHGDRQTRLGHCVHGGGDQGNLELNLAGQLGLEADLVG